MDSITVDGKDEQDFRYQIEDMLRQGRIDEAIEKLRALIAPYAGEGAILPSRFLEVSSADVEFAGWHRLADRVCDHDRPSHPISAIGVALADARDLGGPGPSDGKLAPFIKTFYFSDAAYPFSEATREELLDGYSRDGFEWQGDYQATDVTLSIKGLDDLYGPIIELEDRLFTQTDPAMEEIRAGTIGACYIAALIHKALRDTIHTKGLPRPLCVIAACDGVYPFFDAPVSGSDECEPAEKPAEGSESALPNELEGTAAMAGEEHVEDLPGEASMLDLVSRKGTKKPVIVLDEEDAREAARFTEMASAQRLDIDAAVALKGFAAEASVPPLDNAQVIDDEAFEVPALGNPAIKADHHPSVPPSLQPNRERDAPPQDDPSTGNGSFADFEINPAAETAPAAFESREWPEPDPYAPTSDPALAADPDPVDGPEWPEPDLNPSLADEQDHFDGSAAEPVRHSLRARVEMAQPDYSQTFWEKLSAFLHQFRRKLFRR